MIKTNAGGFASDCLAPVIRDVPVINKILPADLQPQKPDTIATDTASDATLADYVKTYSAMKPKDAATVYDACFTGIVFAFYANFLSNYRYIFRQFRAE